MTGVVHLCMFTMLCNFIHTFLSIMWTLQLCTQCDSSEKFQCDSYPGSAAHGLC